MFINALASISCVMYPRERDDACDTLDRGGGRGVALTIPGSIRDGPLEGGREGGRESASPTCRAPTWSHARRRTWTRIKRLGARRLSNVSHATERRRRRRQRGRWGGTPISSHIRECHPSQRQSTSDRIPGRFQSQQGSGGVGSHPRSPAPGSPSPSLPRERYLGEPVFPGVQIVDRGHWVPQRLPRAGRRHHARAPRRCSGG